MGIGTLELDFAVAVASETTTMGLLSRGPAQTFTNGQMPQASWGLTTSRFILAERSGWGCLSPRFIISLQARATIILSESQDRYHLGRTGPKHR